MAHLLRLPPGDDDRILLILIQLLAVVRVDDAQYNEQYGRVVEAREHDGGLRQDLQPVLDILWMVRRLSYQPDYELGGSDEA